MPKARANINVYSSARISGFIFECEKTVWYQELNHMMLMIDLTWCDLYTTNCEICGTKSSSNRSRCRKHERTSTYTAVRDFRVFLWFCRVCRLDLVVKQSIHAETERPRVKTSRRRYISSNGKWKRKNCIRTRTQGTRPGALRSTALPHGSAFHL